VNTLAFRMPQHNAFFAADADCVGLTEAVPWHLNRQWLDLLASSGTPLFVSAAPAAVGAEQEAALRAAFARAALPQPPGEPLDWMETTCPRRWRFGDEVATYHWQEEV
jgi:alpha-galactosidase